MDKLKGVGSVLAVFALFGLVVALPDLFPDRSFVELVILVFMVLVCLFVLVMGFVWMMEEREARKKKSMSPDELAAYEKELAENDRLAEEQLL